MPNETDTFDSRREFLKGGVRKIALICLILMAGLLGWRGLFKKGNTSSCGDDLPCRECSKLPNCKKPQAVGLSRNYNLSEQSKKF